MDLDALNIVLKANTTDAEQGLTRVSNELGNTAVAAGKVSNSLDQFAFHADLSTRHAIGFSRGLEELALQSNAGQLSMGGFFEVLRVGAQEFSNIQKESGSAATAFKDLFGSIFSTETIILLAITAIGTFISHLLSAKEATDEHKKSLDEFTKSLKGAEAGALASGFQLKEYAKIAADSTIPLKERNTALTEANKILGDHKEKLTLVNVATAEGTKIINDYTTALVNNAVAAKYADRLADISIKQRDFKKAYDESGQAITDFKNKYGNYIFETDSRAKEFLALIQKQRDAFNDYNTTVDDAKDAYTGMNEAAALAVKGVTALGKGAGETGKEIKTVKDIYSELLVKLNQDINNPLFDPQQTVSKEIEDIKNAITKMVDINTPYDNPIMQSLVSMLQDFSADAELNKTLADFAKYVKKNFADELEKAPYEPVKIADSIVSLSDVEAKIALEKMRDTLRNAGRKVFSAQGILSDVNVINDADVKKNFDEFNRQIQNTATIVSNVLAPAFDAVFQAIDSGQNVFKSLIKSIEQTILKMVEAVAEAIIFTLILDVITGGSYSVSGAIMNALGLTSKLPKMAAGGVVTRPTIALVGEAGPERITPLNSITNGNSGFNGGEVVFQISGQTLRGVLARANTTANNVF